MKNLILLLSVMVLALFACKKDSTSSPNSTNTPPPSTSTTYAIQFTENNGNYLYNRHLTVWYGNGDSIYFSTRRDSVVSPTNTYLYDTSSTTWFQHFTVPAISITVPNGTKYIYCSMADNGYFNVTINGVEMSFPGTANYYDYFRFEISGNKFTYIYPYGNVIPLATYYW